MTDSLLYYFGDDKVFFQGLKGILDESSQNSIKIQKFFATQESSIQSLFVEVSQGKPDAVLIDFSLHPEDYLHLARILSRTPFEKDIKIIGILDHLQTNQVLIEAQSTGLSLCFIKSDHIKDITQTLIRLVYPRRVDDPHYVKAKLGEKWLAGLVSKIGYIHEAGLHFETNFKMTPGQMIRLEHFWRNKALIPSKEVIVKKVEEKNLVYNFSYSVDAEFEFIDNITDPDKTPEEEVRRFSLIDEAKYRFKKVFLKNVSSSQAKRAKVLIVDSKFLIYQDKKRSDRFPYMLRSLGSNFHLEIELNKFCPHIIVLSLDEFITEETALTVGQWCLAQPKPPYIIIFNSESAVTEWQTRLGYKNILASSEEINTDILMKMAQVFDQRIKDFEVTSDKKIFISKQREESNCEIEVEIRVDHLSECDLYFSSSKKIPVGSNLSFKSPIKTLAYIVQEQEQNGLFQYQAILHSHDELEKNAIRRYINAILFKENEVQVADKKTLVTQEIKLKQILKNSQLKSGDD